MSQETLPLFDSSGQTDTRAAALQAIKPDRGRLARAVLNVIRQRGRRGATDHEISEALRLQLDTCRARRCEARDRGDIHDSGLRRPTPSGRNAAVWVCAELPPAAPPPAAAPTRPAPATAASKPADRRPARPCYACRSRSFWSHRVSPTHFVCATCHPPVAESHVAARFALPEEAPS